MHDAIHLCDEGLIRLPDSEIAVKAVAESRIVLTLRIWTSETFSLSRAARLQASSSFGSAIKRRPL